MLNCSRDHSPQSNREGVKRKRYFFKAKNAHFGKLRTPESPPPYLWLSPKNHFLLILFDVNLASISKVYSIIAWDIIVVGLSSITVTFQSAHDIDYPLHYSCVLGSAVYELEQHKRIFFTLASLSSCILVVSCVSCSAVYQHTVESSYPM